MSQNWRKDSLDNLSALPERAGYRVFQQDKIEEDQSYYITVPKRMGYSCFTVRPY